MRRNGTLQARLLGAVIFIVAGCALWHTIQSRRVESSQQNPDRAQWASALGNSDARFFSRLGRQDGDIEALRMAVTLQPRLIEAWLELSAIEEQRGNRAFALHALQVARRYSAGYAPRWALANFHLRQGQKLEFWNWARQCAHIPHARRGPLIELCLRVDPEGAFRRLGPSDTEFCREFVRTSLRTGAITAGFQASMHLARNASPEDRSPLLEYCDRLLVQGAAKPAVLLWNTLVPDLPAARPANSLTHNEEFRSPPLGRGFDWRLYPGEGVELRTGRGLEVVLSGGQPQDRVAAEQHVAVIPGSLLRLQVDVGANTSDGLHWIVYPLSDWGLPLARVSLAQPGPADAPFRVPAGVELLRVVLRYQRPIGTVRKPGVSHIRSVRIARHDS